jgi:hypothetical protein
MPVDRQQKITFAEMHDIGVHGLLIYCADYRCSHSLAISGDGWPDDIRPLLISSSVSSAEAAASAAPIYGLIQLE